MPSSMRVDPEDWRARRRAGVSSLYLGEIRWLVSKLGS
jgi:hypothetical protein